MFRVFLLKNQLVVYDKSEKEFKAKYGSGYEQITIIKDYDNIDPVIEKLAKTYRAEIVRDYKIKMKWGWAFWSDELKKEIVKKRSESLKSYVKTEQHRAKLAAKAKKYRHFAGKEHTEQTKAQISFKKKGMKSHLKGTKWMYNPDTGEEKMGKELIEGFFWGRSPEAKDYIKNTRKKK